MGDFLSAAYRTLSEQKRPLSPQEIVRIAIERGFLHSEGKTPHQTMKSKLSTDILQKKEKSSFMRSGPGKFALREWEDEYEEHIAPRYKKALFDEEILVFSRDSLPRYIETSGLTKFGVSLPQLLDECYPMMRRLAEENQNVIQLVSFYIVRYKSQFLTYKRTKRLPESRLHGFYSIGFGGHLNPDDIPPLDLHFDPDYAVQSMVRELREELILDERPRLEFRGLLYDDSREVSKQHIGLVYDVRLQSRKYRIGERGFLIDPKFETLNQILSRIEEFENWSALVAREQQGR